MRIVMRILVVLSFFWQMSSLHIDTIVEEEAAKPWKKHKNTFQYQSDVAALQSNTTVLILGSSVDRYALQFFCESVDGGQWSRDPRISRPLRDPNYISLCSIPQRNIKLAYVFIPGSGPPPYFGCGFMSVNLCGNHITNGDLQHATTEEIVDIDAPDVATRLLETLAPTVVVVESSMWDLARWWMNAGQSPMETYPTPNNEIARWCKTEIPQLMERVRRVFPYSQVVFRTPPTVLKDPPIIGEAPEALERMTECIRTQFRDEEIFDYHQLVDDLLREAPEYRYTAESIFLHDHRHPGKCAGIKYFHALLSKFGLREDQFVAEKCLRMSNERLPRSDVSDVELLDP